MGIKLKLKFLESNRGIIKIIQIILGIVYINLFCFRSGFGCYGYKRFQDGYTVYWNQICLFINIVLLILHLINIKNLKLERVYSIVGAILFLIAFALMVWWLIQYPDWVYANFIIGTVLIFVMMCLYIWDVQILQGESSD